LAGLDRNVGGLATMPVPVPIIRWFLSLALAAIVLSTVGGCDANSFVPPVPPPSGLSDRSTPGPVRSFALILLPEPTDEEGAWEQAMRLEAGLAKVVLSVIRPQAGASPARQAEQIRNAASRGFSTLLVEPMDGPEVVAAVNEVRDKGTPVVLLGRQLSSGDTAKSLTAVVFSPAQGHAQKLAETMVREARDVGLPADGHGLIVRKARVGRGYDGLAEIFESCLKSAGVPSVEVVTYDGDTEVGRRAIMERVVADPRIMYLLSVENEGLASAIEVHDALKSKRTFSLGGCTGNEQVLNGPTIVVCAGLIERNEHKFGQMAFLHALRIAEGRRVPDLLEIPLTFHSRHTKTVASGSTPVGQRPR
jgi:ABC-type sugar transport system substrate-binding protein